MPGMTWDGNANAQLLVSILAVHNEIKVDHNAVAAKMGPNCTSRAVQEQIKKLKKIAGDRSNGSHFDTSSPQSAKATKAGAATKTKTGKAVKAASQKKSRTSKAKILRTDSTEPDSDNDGDLSNDGASPGTNLKANGHVVGGGATGKRLAQSILTAKRNAEEMDGDSNFDIAVKKEKLESGAEEETLDGDIGDAQGGDPI